MLTMTPKSSQSVSKWNPGGSLWTHLAPTWHPQTSELGKRLQTSFEIRKHTFSHLFAPKVAQGSLRGSKVTPKCAKKGRKGVSREPFGYTLGSFGRHCEHFWCTFGLSFSGSVSKSGFWSCRGAVRAVGESRGQRQWCPQCLPGKSLDSWEGTPDA